MSTNALDIARDLLKRGYKPLPIPIGEKGPIIKDWQNLVITSDNVAQYFNGAAINVGVQLGHASGRLLDADLDCIEAVKLAPHFLPATNLIYGRPGKRRSHYLYICSDEPEPKASIKLKDENKAVIVELRFGGGGKGAQSVWPGSIHPSGENYEFDENGTPGSSPFAVFKDAVMKIAVGSLVARHWPAKTRHDSALCVGAFLARAGWDVKTIAHFMLAVQETAGVEDHAHIENGCQAAVDAANLHLKDGKGYGFPALVEVFGEPVAKQIAKLIGYREVPGPASAATGTGVALKDFYAYMPEHNYIFAPAREPWPGSSVNSRIASIVIVDANGNPQLDEDGEQQLIKPSTWLDQNQSVEQMTWAPGLPMIIPDRLISNGGWIERRDVNCFNLYLPPTIVPGDTEKAGPWLDHVRTIYPDDIDHIIPWFAWRVQKPEIKINHALLLGSTAQGIGKDTMLEPVKRAVGPWNVEEVSPSQVMGRFTSFLKRVILRINEARDLGETNRYQFYDHCKSYTAAPPDVLRVDEKNWREHSILNCVGVIITTNHKTDGLFLPAEDRRHYVAWSSSVKEDFDEGYWTKLWGWINAGGDRHVAAYLHAYDLTKLDPKAPPPKTRTFWEIVDANRASEDAELADVVDGMGNPGAITLAAIIEETTYNIELNAWLKDRKNRRVIPHRMDAIGYVPIRNPYADDGLWKISGKRQVVYAQKAMPIRDQLRAAQTLTGAAGQSGR
jgi:Bifunctional DNA primase/polymerase, N-terminal/Family of unknown function (DUF5906)